VKKVLALLRRRQRSVRLAIAHKAQKHSHREPLASPNVIVVTTRLGKRRAQKHHLHKQLVKPNTTVLWFMDRDAPIILGNGRKI
jgi:hypothetical protein